MEIHWNSLISGLIRFLLLLGGLHLKAAAETDPRFYAVMVSAQVQTSPARIHLQWDEDVHAIGYTVARREGTSWNTIANVNGPTRNWTDSDVALGNTYEYRVTKSTSI